MVRQPVLIDASGLTWIASAHPLDVDTPGEEVKGEVQGFEPLVVEPGMFPPAEARPCRVLSACDLGSAVRLVPRKCARQVDRVAEQRHIVDVPTTRATRAEVTPRRVVTDKLGTTSASGRARFKSVEKNRPPAPPPMYATRIVMDFPSVRCLDYATVCGFGS